MMSVCSIVCSLPEVHSLPITLYLEPLYPFCPAHISSYPLVGTILCTFESVFLFVLFVHLLLFILYPTYE